MTLNDPHVGTEPQYRPLGLPGCYRGVHYQPVIIDGGELVVFIGQVRYEWRPNPHRKYQHDPTVWLFNAYTGEEYHNGEFVYHVDRVCDRRLGVIGS